MTDIFFSYSSRDRERVMPVRDAFAAQGFEVFWDQQVPAGVDWDTWIRQHLTKAKCAVVFWSQNSVASDNVRHEATVAKQQGKLVPALLEQMSADKFPMGLYNLQCANLSAWDGNQTSAEWVKLRNEVEAKLTPLWVQRRIHELEAELVAERARRASAEARDKAFQAQIAKEAEGQVSLKRDLDFAKDEAAALKARLEETLKARSDLETRAVSIQQRLSGAEAIREAAKQQLDNVLLERDKLRNEVGSAKTMLENYERQLLEVRKNVPSEAVTPAAVGPGPSNISKSTNARHTSNRPSGIMAAIFCLFGLLLAAAVGSSLTEGLMLGATIGLGTFLAVYAVNKRL